jgi:hypothetical protein
VALLPLSGRAAADRVAGADIVNVDVPGLEPIVTEEGERLHATKGGGPFTAQFRFTWPEKPPCCVNVKTSVTCIPVCVVNVDVAGTMEKSEGGLNVAVTDSAEFKMTVQTLGFVPVQAPLHPPKEDVPAVVAVSERDVPGA